MKGYEIKRITKQGKSSIVFGKFYTRESDARKEANRLNRLDLVNTYKVVGTEA